MPTKLHKPDRKAHPARVAGILLRGLSPPFFSTYGNVPSSQLTEHRAIANAACPFVALSGPRQNEVIH
jgi:hypothetical protein